MSMLSILPLLSADPAPVAAAAAAATMFIESPPSAGPGMLLVFEAVDEKEEIAAFESVSEYYTDILSRVCDITFIS